MSMTERNADGARAFTLIELISLIVLLAIMAAVAVPAIGGLPGTRAVAAARQLARDLTYARQQALARGVTVWVVFNTGQESYSVMVESATAPGRSFATTMTDPATGSSFVQTYGVGEFVNIDIVSVTIGSDSGTDLGFDWLGRPVNVVGSFLTTASTITLSGGNSVIVEPQTGAARVQP